MAAGLRSVKLGDLLPALKGLVEQIYSASDVYEESGRSLSEDELADKMVLRMATWNPKVRRGLSLRPVLANRETRVALARFISGLVVALT